MNRSAVRLALLLGPLVWLTSCASDKQRTVDLLNTRLQATMGVEIAANRVALQPQPDGATVTLLDSSLLPDDVGALDNRGRDPRASLIQGLLDPSLIRMQVADNAPQPAEVRATRVRNFVDYLQEYRLGGIVQATDVPDAPPDAASPAGLAVTIHIVCPGGSTAWGYGTGQAMPDCY